MDNKQQPSNEENLSRKEYREQLERQRRHQSAADVRGTEESPEPVATDRQQFVDERETQSAEQKTTVLKRKLNIAIIGLVVAIIIVYLILFYVG